MAGGGALAGSEEGQVKGRARIHRLRSRSGRLLDAWRFRPDPRLTRGMQRSHRHVGERRIQLRRETALGGVDSSGGCDNRCRRGGAAQGRVSRIWPIEYGRLC